MNKINIKISEKNFLRLLLLLPIIIPMILWPLAPTAFQDTFWGNVASICFMALAAGPILFAGPPYLILIIILCIYSKRQNATEFKKTLYYSPLFLMCLEPFYLVIFFIHDSNFDFFEILLLVTICILFIGYFYILLGSIIFYLYQAIKKHKHTKNNSKNSL